MPARGSMPSFAEQQQLIESAMRAQSNACAPYSNFPVGAALLAANGMIYTGVNVESSSFGGTICAERTALVKALSEGEREFVAIAIVTNAEMPTMPCGICRQLLHDYAPGLWIISKAGGTLKLATLHELLPDAFDAGALTPRDKEREIPIPPPFQGGG